MASNATANVHRLASEWGERLDPSDYERLGTSWIAPAIADAAMLRRVNAHQGRDIVGQKGSRDCSGILIPYYWPDATHPHTYRIRRDNPDREASHDGTKKETAKYLSAPGGANRLYVPPGVTLAQLGDTTTPIALVEGEKKALALWRLANHDIDRPRFIPIAIGGVWSWRGKVGKTGGPNGERLDVKGPIPDLSRIEWSDRTVFIIFDANVHTNQSVKTARTSLCRELTTRKAKPNLVALPENCGVNGIDDLLAAWGPERVLALFDAASSGMRLHVTVPPNFQSRPDGLFRITQKGERLTETRLTNFQAVIMANIRLDDGVETSYEFEISAELLGRKSVFTIPSSKFAGMEWPIERLGAIAIIYPNQREHARTAIQSLSMAAEDRSVFTHTGWRKLDRGWVYLHAGGAITGTGLVNEVKVKLAGAMSRFELCIPATSEDTKVALRASLNLLDLAPDEISFPLLAATYRSVLGDTDFAVHLAGESGAFKSELAALHQQHFGAGMDRLHLPGSWSSTANALETLAFIGKDGLVVIDDFAPQGSSAEVARYHAAADRVFRAAGNHAGRSRLDATAKLRESKPPRALVLSTGEDIPRGHSIRARLLTLELSRGDIDSAALAKAQQKARAGRFSQSMGAYVLWLARQYDNARARFSDLVAHQRNSALSNRAHARTPDIIANLQASFELFLEFCREAEAITASERHALLSRCSTALDRAAAIQAKHQLDTDPATRFVTLIRSVLVSGCAHLESRSGGEPSSPAACGWRKDVSGSCRPMGECIGWIDDNNIHLEPTAAFPAAQVFGRDIGEPLPISEQTLRKRLHEKGFLASIDESRQTLTVRRTLGGSSKNVLHLHRGSLLPDTSDDADKNVA